MLYLSIVYLILTIFSSIFICNKCKKIENSKDSVAPLYEFLIGFKKIPSWILYLVPNLILTCLILYFNFINLPLSIVNIHEMILVFVTTQIGYYLICYDLKTFIIPNKITFPTIIALLIFSLCPPVFAWEKIIYALIAFGIIFGLQIINPKGIGGGDAKLCAIMAFMMRANIESLFFVLVGFVLGGLVNILFMVFKLIRKKDFVPYGLYFYIGACLIYAFNSFIFIQ